MTVPPGVAAKFGDLIELIKASESMNDEERRYWINILPIMTPEQIGNLREILQNEKEQLAAIDEKYATEMRKVEDAEAVRRTGENLRQRRTTRTAAETSNRKTEEQEAEELLKKIEGQA